MRFIQWLSLVIFLFVSQFSFTQNLISNPGFESLETSNLGFMYGTDTVFRNEDDYCMSKLNKTNVYEMTDSSWSNTHFAMTPDIFSYSNFSLFEGEYGCRSNVCYEGFVAFGGPYKGDRMGGFVPFAYQGLCNGHFCSEYREYFQNRLVDSLKVGHNYCLSFYLRSAKGTYFEASGLGATISDTLIYTDRSSYVLYADSIAHVMDSNIDFGEIRTSTDSWVKIEGSFEADKNAVFLLIGNFRDEKDISYRVVADENYDLLQKATYYFIDEVDLHHLEQPNVVKPEDSIFCYGSSVELEIENFTTHQWKDGSSNLLSSDSKCIFELTKNTTIFLEARTCSDFVYRDTFNFYVHPYGDILPNDTILCPSDLLTIQLPSNILSAKWNDDFQGLNRKLEQEFQYIVNAVDSNYCDRVDTLNLVYEKLPFINFYTDTLSFCDRFEVAIDDYYGNLSWSNGDKGSRSIIINEGEYNVVASNQCGVDSINFYAKKLPNIEVPNVITPNNDDKNDCLYIDYLDNLNNTLEVYSRWGEPVYKVDDYNNNWCPVELNDGTYYYLLKVDGCPDVKGFIYIVK